MLVRSGAIDCVVIDSVAALVPRAEIEGEIGDYHRRSASTAHVPSASKTCGFAFQIQYHVHLHQSAARENRRDVRQPRNHNRRSCSEVLLQRSNRRTSHRLYQDAMVRSLETVFAPRSSRTRLRRRFVKRSSILCTVRAFRERDASSIWRLRLESLRRVRRLVHVRRRAPRTRTRSSKAYSERKPRSARGTGNEGSRSVRHSDHHERAGRLRRRQSCSET